MSLAEFLLAVLVGAYACATLIALLAPSRFGRAVATVATTVGAATSLILGGAVIAGLASPVASIPWFLLGPLRFHLDPLGAFFLIVVGLITLAAGLYGFGYLRDSPAATRRSADGLVNLLVLAMSLQVMADNPLTFLFVWELISLAACFLVLAEHDHPDAISAGQLVPWRDPRGFPGAGRDVPPALRREPVGPVRRPAGRRTGWRAA